MADEDGIPKETIKKLFRSREVMLEVLRDRGYEVADDMEMEYDDFLEMVTDADNLTILRDRMLLYVEEKCVVIWITSPKLGTDMVKKIKNIIDEYEVNRAIAIVDIAATPEGKKSIKNLAILKKYIDVYTLNEAQFNVMKHEYTPEHTVCTQVEKRRVMKKYAVTPSQIPRISLSDPVVRHFGARPNQLLKIKRESETQLNYYVYYYRLVN